MKQRRRLIRDLQLRLELLSALGVGEQLLLRFACRQLVIQDEIDQLLPARLNPRELALRRVNAGAAFHAQPIHLLRELAAELLEEVLPHQLVLQRAQDPRFDFLTWDRQPVFARAATASTEASEVLARVDDEPGAADAALRQTGEQVLGSSELVESFGPAPLSSDRCVPISHRSPELIVQDS